MAEVIQLVGPERAVELFGVRLVGINAESGHKLALTVVLITVVFLIGWALSFLKRLGHSRGGRVAFGISQGVSLALALVLVVGLIS